MKCFRSKEKRVFELNEPEAFFLANSFRQLEKHYQVDKEELSEVLRSYWQGSLSRSSGSSQALENEQALLEEERFFWRSQRLSWIQNWLKSYEEGEEWTLVLDSESFELFLCIVNDRRLILALEYGVSEKQMDQDPREIKDNILRQAIWEIHLLAVFQEQCLAMEQGDKE